MKYLRAPPLHRLLMVWALLLLVVSAQAVSPLLSTREGDVGGSEDAFSRREGVSRGREAGSAGVPLPARAKPSSAHPLACCPPLTCPECGRQAINITVHEGTIHLIGLDIMVIRDCVFVQTGDIIIEDHAKLVVVNATLYLNCTAPLEFGIVATEHGTLSVSSAEIETSYLETELPQNDTQAYVRLIGEAEGYFNTSAIGPNISLSCGGSSYVLIDNSSIHALECSSSSQVTIKNHSAITGLLLLLDGDYDVSLNVTAGPISHLELGAANGLSLTLEISNSTVSAWRLFCRGQGALEISSSSVDLVRCDESSSVKISNSTVGQVVCAGSSSIEISNSSLDSLVMSLEDDANITISSLAPGYVGYWNICENTTAENVGWNLTLVNASVMLWELLASDNATVDISNSSVAIVLWAGQGNITAYNSSLAHILLTFHDNLIVNISGVVPGAVGYWDSLANLSITGGNTWHIVLNESDVLAWRVRAIESAKLNISSSTLDIVLLYDSSNCTLSSTTVNRTASFAFSHLFIESCELTALTCSGSSSVEIRPSIIQDIYVLANSRLSCINFSAPASLAIEDDAYASISNSTLPEVWGLGFLSHLVLVDANITSLVVEESAYAWLNNSEVSVAISEMFANLTALRTSFGLAYAHSWSCMRLVEPSISGELKSYNASLCIVEYANLTCIIEARDGSYMFLKYCNATMPVAYNSSHVVAFSSALESTYVYNEAYLSLENSSASSITCYDASVVLLASSNASHVCLKHSSSLRASSSYISLATAFERAEISANVSTCSTIMVFENATMRSVGSYVDTLSCQERALAWALGCNVSSVSAQDFSLVELINSTLGAASCSDRGRVYVVNCAYPAVPSISDSAEMHVCWYLTVRVLMPNRPFYRAPVEVYWRHNTTMAANKTISKTGLTKFVLREKVFRSTGVDYIGNYTVMTYYLQRTYVVGKAIELETNKYVELLIRPPTFVISPSFGEIGSIIKLVGSGFMPNSTVSVFFNASLLADVWVDATGSFDIYLTLPAVEAGWYLVNASDTYGCWAIDDFSLYDKMPLTISVNVGQLHFRGEIVESYVLVTRRGRRVDATSVNATLLFPSGQEVSLPVSHLARGIYKICYTLPGDAEAGTYALLVESCLRTEYVEAYGVEMATFLLSPTLTQWNATLVTILNDTATIRTDVGTVLVNLTELSAEIADVREGFVVLNTTAGEILARLDAINATLAELRGDVAEIKTALGNITVALDELESTITDVRGDVAVIKTRLGYLEANVSLIRDYLSSVNATLDRMEGLIAIINANQTEIRAYLMALNASLARLMGDVAIINTTLGALTASVRALEARVSLIINDIVIVATRLGEIRGILVDIRGDVAEIKTTLGNILAKLEELTGESVHVVAGGTSYRILVLARPAGSLAGKPDYEEDGKKLTIRKVAGRSAYIIVLIPRELLAALGSDISRVEAETIYGPIEPEKKYVSERVYLIAFEIGPDIEELWVYLAGKPFKLEESIPWIALGVFAAVVACAFIWWLRRR